MFSQKMKESEQPVYNRSMFTIFIMDSSFRHIAALTLDTFT